MNIKEHIEAGHYPKDDKGRALVPMKDGLAAILMTDCPDRDRPILGYRVRTDYHCEVLTWKESGEHYGGNYDLLPPPPRKVKVTRWALYRENGVIPFGLYDSLHDAESACKHTLFSKGVVELTGEYEEPWS